MSTQKQKRVAKDLLENNGKSVSQAMRDAGYPDTTASNPQQLTRSKGWAKLMEKHLPDKNLGKKHEQLLNSTKLEHMTFPADNEKAKDRITDDDIIKLLAGVNCIVQRIAHGEQARHVYFWANDNNALEKGLTLAYKLKGRINSKEDGGGDVTINWLQIIHGDTKLNDRPAPIEGVAYVKPLQDSKQARPIDSVQKKPSTTDVQSKPSQPKPDIKGTPAWILSAPKHEDSNSGSTVVKDFRNPFGDEDNKR